MCFNLECMRKLEFCSEQLEARGNNTSLLLLKNAVEILVRTTFIFYVCEQQK